MLPANHPAVVAECERRADVKLARECPDEDDDGQSPKRRKRQTEKEPHDSLVEKETVKWKSLHIEMAEKRHKAESTELSFTEVRKKVKESIFCEIPTTTNDNWRSVFPCTL